MNLCLLNAEDKEQMIAKALQLNLDKHPQWLKLLHFKGMQSQIDAPDFFYAKNGKYDPKEELIATINEFYKPLPKMQKPASIALDEISTHPYDTHAICRFKARFVFLNTQLNFTHLPQIECFEYQNMLEYIDPQAISIVFPAAHINSPASMFGHTFLLFHSSFESSLLSFGVNFAAAADENTENGFMFAIRGIFGLYDGYYSIHPYYEMLKEYRDSESRDIWEFKLNFTKEETINAFNHIWELRNVHSDYYFFDENCSYNILWILEAARPQLDLHKEFFYYVIPSETIFALQKHKLIVQEQYRPSKRRILKEYEKMFSYSELKNMQSVLKQKKTLEHINFDNQEKEKLFLEALLELNEYNYMSGDSNKEDYIDMAYEIALRRSKLGKSTPLSPSKKASLLYGHRATRMYAGFMKQYKQKLKGTIEGRISYHDLSDSDKGYLEGTQIEFLKLLLSYDEDSIKAEHFTLLSLASMVPISTLFQPFSYRLYLGAERIFQNINPLAKLQAGLTFNIGKIGYVYYLSGGMALNNKKPMAAFINNIGIVVGGQTPYKALVEYSHIFYTHSIIQNTLKTSLHYSFTQNYAFYTHYEYNKFNNYDAMKRKDSIHAGIRVYF